MYNLQAESWHDWPRSNWKRFFFPPVAMPWPFPAGGPASVSSWVETEVEVEGESSEFGVGDVLHVDHYHWLNSSAASEPTLSTSRFNVVQRLPSPAVRDGIKSTQPNVAVPILDVGGAIAAPVAQEGSVTLESAGSHTQGSLMGSEGRHDSPRKDMPVRFASDALTHVLCNDFVARHSFSKHSSERSLRRRGSSNGAIRYSFRMQRSDGSSSDDQSSRRGKKSVARADGFVNTPVAGRDETSLTTSPVRRGLTSPPRDSPPTRTSVAVQSDFAPPTVIPAPQPPFEPTHVTEVQRGLLDLLKTALEGNIAVATSLASVALEAVKPQPQSAVVGHGVRARDLFSDREEATLAKEPMWTSSSSSSSGDCSEGGHACRYHRHRRREGNAVRIERATTRKPLTALAPTITPTRIMEPSAALPIIPPPPTHHVLVQRPPDSRSEHHRSAAISSNTSRVSHTTTVNASSRLGDGNEVGFERGRRLSLTPPTYLRMPSSMSEVQNSSFAINTSFSEPVRRVASSVSISTSTRALGTRYRSPSLTEVQNYEAGANKISVTGSHRSYRHTEETAVFTSPQVRRGRLLPPPPSPPQEPLRTVSVRSCRSRRTSRTVSASSFADVEGTTSPISAREQPPSLEASRALGLTSRRSDSVGLPFLSSHTTHHTEASIQTDALVHAKESSPQPQWLSLDSTPLTPELPPPALARTLRPEQTTSPPRFALNANHLANMPPTRDAPRFRVPR